MSANILDRLISAFVGAVSAVGTVWFLDANAPDAASTPPASVDAPAKFERLEVDALRVNEVLFVADPETNEPTIELRGGSISAQENVFAEQIGAFRVLGQKLQATPDDPLNSQSPVFAELATNQDGGAYLALLSPQETHSVTIGFDKTEKGCLVSQNNEDSSMIAQAIFVKPTADSVSEEPSSEPSVEPASPDAPTPENSADAPLQVPPAVPETPLPVAPAAPSVPETPLPVAPAAPVSPDPLAAPSV